MITIRPALALVIVSIALQGLGRSAAPFGTLVNGVGNPLAIDRDTTRFTWMSPDIKRGERQTAYQILVSSSAERLRDDKADYWDSGKVESDKSASVEYTGKPLPAATRFWWKVRVWDQTGEPSDYSAPNCFGTGLNQNEWTAHSIWDETAGPNHFAYFRKTFEITTIPNLAKVYVTAFNDYLLYCNGQLLGRGPARCDPYHYGQYNAYNVTKLLKTGTNVFAAIGHRSVTWSGNINAKPAFLLEARLSYSDGSSSVMGTDESWKVLSHTAFIETNATYFGGGRGNRAAIRFDSRLEPSGWRTAGFDDSGWAAATVADRSDYHLFAQMAPLDGEQAELRPVSVTFTNGAWLADFGECIDGWPKITLRANHPGDAVRVEYFQMSGERKPAGWDEYICHGGKETWDANFGRYTSFETVRITGYAGKLRASDLRGIWAYGNAEVAGQFRCSSDLLNNVYNMCERSARQNVQQGIISVDAQREQLPWLADAWNIGNVLLYNDRGTAMIDKVVRDFAGEQMTNGYIRNVSPGHGFEGADGHGRIPEWAMYWPMLLWQQYLFSGDETLLREMSPRLALFLDWIKAYQDPATKLLNPAKMWRISEFAGGDMPSGGDNVATACEYYQDLRIASRVFSALGQASQSAGYLQQAEEVKRGINAHLLTHSASGEFYRARTDTSELFPLASAWPLRFDIEPAADEARILDTIEKAGKPDIGGYGGDAFYSGLLNAGGGALVVNDLNRYQPMLDSNKTCWEQFGPRGEVNHAWTSYPGYLFQQYILGIQPTSGGFATFDVRPDTGGLTYAEGLVPTVKGFISTRWAKDADDRFTLSVHVPANSRATIYIPKLVKGNFTITESGKRLWPVISNVTDPGVLAVSEAEASVKCTVEAGNYRFEETRSNAH